VALLGLSARHNVITSRRLGRWLQSAWATLSARAIFPAFAIYCCNYVLIGAGLWVLARGLAMPDTMSLAALTSAFALSWVLGFLAPGTPAGLGVREGILVLLLAESGTPDEVLLFVIIARLATMLGDGLCFLAAWIPSRKVIKGGK
jgi:hypothetical protein